MKRLLAVALWAIVLLPLAAVVYHTAHHLGVV